MGDQREGEKSGEKSCRFKVGDARLRCLGGFDPSTVQYGVGEG